MQQHKKIGQIKHKFLETIALHPTALRLGIGMAIFIAVGIGLSGMENHMAYAHAYHHFFHGHFFQQAPTEALDNMFFKKLIGKSADVMAVHPRLFGIAAGFAITLTVGTAVGMLDGSHHLAFANNNHMHP